MWMRLMRVVRVLKGISTTGHSGRREGRRVDSVETEGDL